MKAIEYLQDNSRTANTKASVHVLEQEACEESDLAEAVKKLASEQKRCQTQVLESLANMSLASNERFHGVPTKRVPSFGSTGKVIRCSLLYMS